MARTLWNAGSNMAAAGGEIGKGDDLKTAADYGGYSAPRAPRKDETIESMFGSSAAQDRSRKRDRERTRQEENRINNKRIAAERAAAAAQEKKGQELRDQWSKTAPVLEAKWNALKERVAGARAASASPTVKNEVDVNLKDERCVKADVNLDGEKMATAMAKVGEEQVARAGITLSAWQKRQLAEGSSMTAALKAGR